LGAIVEGAAPDLCREIGLRLHTQSVEVGGMRRSVNNFGFAFAKDRSYYMSRDPRMKMGSASCRISNFAGEEVVHGDEQLCRRWRSVQRVTSGEAHA
jgi:hypothetical protein